MALTPGVYSRLDILPPGTGTIVYRYTFRNELNASSKAAAPDAEVGSIQASCDAAVFPQMKEFGIPDPEVTYEYLSADGAMIWMHSFDPS